MRYSEIVMSLVANAYPGRAILVRGIRSFAVQHQHVYLAVASIKNTRLLPPHIADYRAHILCAALNCVSLSIGLSVVPITLFIIGVME